MQRLIFTLICTLLLLKPTANAIFLANLGVENLPIAYIALAFLALGVSIAYNKYVNIASTYKLFIKSNIINIILLVLIGFMLLNQWSKSATAFIFYLFISIFGILSASQFWIIANQIFNAREARKYFGFIGSGAIAGGIAGGYLASVISSTTQSEYIPFAGALMLIYSTFLVNKLRKNIGREFSSGQPQVEIHNLLGPLRMIREIRHLKYLALLLAISVFVAKLIDYQFGYFASRMYTNEEDLTQFYGFWFSTFNIISLLIQLFLTNRIVGRLGVGYSILILPSLILINASLLILFPVLVLVVSLRLFDAGMKQSINKASMELMMLPVPQDIKLRTKTFLDVFVDSLATGISGIILLFVIKALDLPNQVISFIILFGSFIWFYFGNKMRVEYRSVFRQSLKIQSEQIANSGTTIIEDYHQLLQSGSEFQILKALTFLKDQPISGLEEDIQSLLKSNNEKIINTTLELIMYREDDYHEAIIPLLHHHDQNVKINSFEYLINHQKNLEPNFLIQLLNEGEDQIRIAAIAAYAKEFQNNRSVLNVLRISDRIQSLLKQYSDASEENLFITVGLLKAISLGKFSEHYSYINKCLDHPSEQVIHHAIIAAGETRSSTFMKKLLNRLEEENVPKIIFPAIAKFGIDRISKIMEKAISEGNIKLASKMPYIFEKIPTQQSIEILQNLAEHPDFILKSNAISALNNLTDQFPILKVDDKIINRILLSEAQNNNLLLNALLIKDDPENPDFQELVRVLKKRIDDNLAIIFKLLNIKYPPDDYLEILSYVTGPDQALRENSIEYLENTLGPPLRSTIISLIEYSVLQHETGLRNKNINISNDIIQDFLCNNDDEAIKSIASKYFNKI